MFIYKRWNKFIFLPSPSNTSLWEFAILQSLMKSNEKFSPKSTLVHISRNANKKYAK